MNPFVQTPQKDIMNNWYYFLSAYYTLLEYLRIQNSEISPDEMVCGRSFIIAHAALSNCSDSSWFGHVVRVELPGG